MPVSADTLRALIAAGVTGDALVSVVERIDADMQAVVPVKVRSSGAERQARYRAKLVNGVTESDVTANVTGDVTAPPNEVRSNPPKPSLRSERERAGREAAPAFRQAYPLKPGAKWQNATEKFIRLVRDGTSAEAIIDGAKRYAVFRAGEDPQYTADPYAFLSKKRWLDDFEKPSQVHRPANNARAGPPQGRENGIFAALRGSLSDVRPTDHPSQFAADPDTAQHGASRAGVAHAARSAR